MNISSIGNQTKPYISPQNQSNDTIDSLRKQRERLAKQLEDVKSRPKNSQAEQDAAVAQKQLLKSRLPLLIRKSKKVHKAKMETQAGQVL